jgi:predicted DNA-binding antitoxin AbrB/MazE fold protein
MENTSPAFASVDAVYRRGVFEPLQPVNLVEEQHVRLSIQPAGNTAAIAWLTRVQKMQEEIVQRAGRFPDSAPDIAADRQR